MKLINIILENEIDLSENKALKDFMTKSLKNLTTNTVAGLRSINPTLADDLVKIVGARQIKGITNADELINLLKSNKLTASGMGDLMVGALKSNGVSDDFLRVIVPRWVDDPRFIKAWTSDPNKKLTKKALMNKGYTSNAADEIIFYAKRSDKFKSGLVKTGGGTKTGGKTKLTPQNVPGGWEKFKNMLTSKWSWKKILAWGGTVGLAGAGLWYLIKDNWDGELPEGMPETPPSDYAPCVQNLLDTGKGNVVTSNSGQVSVLVYDETYPKGVKIFSNGRIFDIATGRMGRWTCKEGQVQSTNESKKKLSMLSIIYEQVDEQMGNDVSKMIDFLDFPVSRGNLDSATQLLDKYVKSGKAKEFLSLYQKSGLGGGDINKTIKYISAFDPNTVQSKDRLQQLVNKALSGSSSGSSLTGSLSDLNIVWDSGTSSGGSSSSGMSYFSCEDWDLRTKPYILGCKATRISEVQSCLGLTPDGKFGPKTEKALKDIEADVSNGITAQIYNRIMKDCGRPELDLGTSTTGSTETPTTTEPTPTEPTPTEPTPTGETQTTVADLMFGDVQYSLPEETGEQFYMRLLNNNVLKGSPDKNRIKYKNAPLSESDYDKLSQYLATFGFYPMKAKEKGDEQWKYVWKKIRNEE